MEVSPAFLSDMLLLGGRVAKEVYITSIECGIVPKTAVLIDLGWFLSYGKKPLGRQQPLIGNIFLWAVLQLFPKQLVQISLGNKYRFCHRCHTVQCKQMLIDISKRSGKDRTHHRKHRYGLFFRYPKVIKQLLVSACIFYPQ